MEQYFSSISISSPRDSTFPALREPLWYTVAISIVRGWFLSFKSAVFAGVMRFMPMTASYPPTVIVRSPRENPKKCSVLPLRGRGDLVFLTYPVVQPPLLHGYLRLTAEGEVLSPGDADRVLLLLDASSLGLESMRQTLA